MKALHGLVGSAIFTALVLVSASCAKDSGYTIDSIKDVDCTMTIFEDGLEFPLGTTGELTLARLMGFAGSSMDFLSEDEHGNYCIRYSDNIDLTDQLDEADIADFTAMEGVVINCAVNGPTYKISDAVEIPAGIGQYASSYEIDGLKVDVDESVKVTVISSDDIPEIVEHITEITFNDVYLRCSCDVEGLPELVDGDYMVDVQISLPDCISPTAIPVQGVLDANGHYACDPVRLENIHDVDVDSDEGVMGIITFKGDVTATSKGVEASSLGRQIKANIRMEICDADGNLSVSTIRGHFNYDFSYDSEIVLEGVDEALGGEDVCLDIADPQLLLELKGNIGLALGADIEITPWRNGGPEGEVLTVKGVRIPKTESAAMTETLRLCLGNKESSCPGGYEFVKADIASLIRDLPQKLQVSLKCSTDASSESLFDTGAEYFFNVGYEFNMPLEAGPDFKIAMTSLIDMSEEVVGYLTQGAALGLKINALNSIPLGLDLDLEFVDSNGGVVNVTDGRITAAIAPGRAGEAVASVVPITLKALPSADNSAVTGLRIKFALRGSEIPEPLTRSSYIKADISAFLKELTLSFDEKQE